MARNVLARNVLARVLLIFNSSQIGASRIVIQVLKMSKNVVVLNSLRSPLVWKQEALSWSIIGIPLVLFVWTLYGLVPTAPFVDDFDSILNFFIEFKDQPTTLGKLQRIFAQHNEHRIIVTRSLSVFLYTLRGSVEFDLLDYFGIGFLVGFAILIYASFRRTKTPLIAAVASLPCFLMIFQPQPLECLVWSTVSVAICGVLLFSGLTLWFITSNYRWYLPLSLVTTAITLGSLGNGVIIFPSVSFLLLLSGRYRDLLVWGAGCLILIGLYFWGYIPNPGHPSVLESLPEVSRNFLYTLYFIGSALCFGNADTAMWLGILAYVALAILLVIRYDRENPVVFGMILFLFGSIWVNALSRSEYGIMYALNQNRYGLYSALTVGLLASALCSVASGLPKQYAMTLCSGLIITTVLFSYWSYGQYTEPLRQHNRRLRAGTRQWAQTGVGLSYPWADRANSIMEESVKRQIYVLPPRLEKLWKRRVTTLSDS